MGMEYKLLFETMIIIKLFPKVISSHKVQALSPSTHTHTYVWNKISWLKRRDRKRDPSGPTLLALPFPTYMLQFALGVAVNFLRYIFLPLLAVQLCSFAVKVTPYLQRNAKFSPWGGMRNERCAQRLFTVSRNGYYEIGHWICYSFSNMNVYLVQDPVSGNNKHQIFRYLGI